MTDTAPSRSKATASAPWFLFALYEKLTAPLTAGLKEPRRERKRK